MLKRPLVLSVAFISVLTAACGAKFSKKGQPAAGNGQPAPAAPYARGPHSYNTLNPNAPAVAPAAQDYPHAQLDPYADPQLLDNGAWVDIHGQRFYRPNLTRVEDGNGWQPYQDGRWTYDDERGWTWVSNDPWGHLTDHYGVWRHHGRHGWVWLPFKTMDYQPHCVTWFDEGDNIGWYPYYSDYSEAYRWTDAHGFDDGYWHRDRLMVSFQSTGFRFHIGFTLVNRSNATQPRIRAHLIRDRRLILDFAFRAHSHGRGRVGRHPGGDRHRSHEFVQRFAPSVLAPRGRAHVVRSRGGAQIIQPFNGRTFDRDGDGRRDGRDGGRDGRHDGRRDGGRDARPDARRDGDQRRDGRGTPGAQQQTPPPSSTSAPPSVGPGRGQRDGGSDRRQQQPSAATPSPTIITPAGTDPRPRDGQRQEREGRGQRDDQRRERGADQSGGNQDRGGARGRPDTGSAFVPGSPSGAQSAPVDAGSRRGGRRG